MEDSEILEKAAQYSPLKVPESPANKHKGNLTGIPRIVHDSSADLYNCIQEWNGAHLIAVGIIFEISNLKMSHLNCDYPEGLSDLCNRLQEVCLTLNTVVDKLKKINDHFEGVMKLNEMKNIYSPVFTTWRIQEFVELSQKIYDMYSQELKMKIYIKENIGHLKIEENLSLYKTIWVQQPYIENVDLQIAAMLKETNLRPW